MMDFETQRNNSLIRDNITAKMKELKDARKIIANQAHTIKELMEQVECLESRYERENMLRRGAYGELDYMPETVKQRSKKATEL